MGIAKATHFLGDGYSLISTLAKDNPFVKWRNYGGTVPQLWVTEFLGERSSENVLTAYRTVAIFAGLFYLTSITLVAKKLFTANRDRFLFLFGLSSGGYMLMFFGYVENYAMFIALTGIFCLIGLLITNGQLNRWWIVPAFFLLPLFHVFGAMMLPAAIYILIHDTEFEKKLSAFIQRQKLISDNTRNYIFLFQKSFVHSLEYILYVDILCL